jgi:hypothetical protein
MMSGKMVTQEEKVEVPVGKYDAVVGAATLEWMGQKLELSNYFAKGVGIVKIRSMSGGKVTEWELTKFEAAK